MALNLNDLFFTRSRYIEQNAGSIHAAYCTCKKFLQASGGKSVWGHCSLCLQGCGGSAESYKILSPPVLEPQDLKLRESMFRWDIGKQFFL